MKRKTSWKGFQRPSAKKKVWKECIYFEILCWGKACCVMRCGEPKANPSVVRLSPEPASPVGWSVVSPGWQRGDLLVTAGWPPVPAVVLFPDWQQSIYGPATSLHLNRLSYGAYILICLPPTKCHMSCVMCHVSGVRCQMSDVTCHMSCVRCQVSHVKCHMDKVVELVGGGSVINEAYPVQFTF